MASIRPLKNSVRKYAWGSYTAIPELLGEVSPADAPWAEMWMGAHSQAPSLVKEGDRWRPLSEVIAENPAGVLGSSVADTFSGALPFLFKVLAAEKPLSIQVHPNQLQARRGFERENRAGIPLDAPHRNYKDAMPKPECLVALTPFTALCGFRQISDICSRLERLGVRELAYLAEELKRSSDASGLRRFMETLLTLPEQRARGLVSEIVGRAGKMAGEEAVFSWIVRLHHEYPEDVGVLSPALLNLVQLTPGEAIFLPAGILHAYLGGVGLELMANSDNVLRGGLTPKYVDVSELLQVLDFQPRRPEILTPVPVSAYEQVYPTAAEEFILSVLRVSPSQGTVGTDRSGTVEILFCTAGEALLREETAAAEETVCIRQGQSALVPASAGPYTLTGEAVIYKASVPQAPAGNASS